MDGEYHLPPKYPLGGDPQNEFAPFSPPLGEVPRPPYSSISMEAPVSAQHDGSSANAERKITCDQSSLTTSDPGGRFLRMDEDSAVVRETGAAADLLGSRRLGNRNLP